MFWTIFTLLLMVWLLGMVTANTVAGFIHLLLIVAVAMVLVRVIHPERPV